MNDKASRNQREGAYRGKVARRHRRGLSEYLIPRKPSDSAVTRAERRSWKRYPWEKYDGEY